MQTEKVLMTRKDKRGLAMLAIGLFLLAVLPAKVIGVLCALYAAYHIGRISRVFRA